MVDNLIKIRNWRQFTRVIILLGFVFSILAGVIGSEGQAQENSKSCLWSIQQGSHKIFMLGSIHVLKSAYQYQARG